MIVAAALRAALHARLPDLVETAYRTEDWHSATFAGTRHVFAFELAICADVAAFARDIADAEIVIQRGFVADVAVTGSDAGRIEVAALTINA